MLEIRICKLNVVATCRFQIYSVGMQVMFCDGDKDDTATRLCPYVEKIPIEVTL